MADPLPPPLLPADPTLDEVRAALAPILPRHAAFDGWSDAAVASAAAERGLDPAMARLAFPGGPRDMVDAWFAAVDAAMLDRWPPDRLAELGVRGRIEALVIARLEQLAPHRESLRRALALLAQPWNLAFSARLGWRAADLMWRAAGDEATDFNHYSKRLTLSGIYAATLLAFLDDDSEGLADSRAFLARRIQDIGRIEGMKRRRRARTEHRPSLARFVGRLRYPPRTY